MVNGKHSGGSPACAARGATSSAAAAAIANEDSEIRLRHAGVDQVIAIVELRMACIREHQGALIEERLRGIAAECGGRIALSLQEVIDITSAGINALLVAHAECGRLGGHVAIFGASTELRNLFRLTHLDRAFVIARDQKEAIASFEPSRARRSFWSARRAA
jgi:anti-anti-sigma regulatory factor